MKIKVIAFGIVKDIIGGKEVELEFNGENTVKELKLTLIRKYPKIDGLASLLIAVNQEYADLDLKIHPTDEIVLIPPVSGG